MKNDADFIEHSRQSRNNVKWQRSCRPEERSDEGSLANARSFLKQVERSLPRQGGVGM